MFLRSKNKREEILLKLQLSKDKDRRTSRQKRRDVEAGVDKFINTMNNFKNSRLSFKDTEIQNKTLDGFQMRNTENAIGQVRKQQLYNTPSVKDIHFSKDQQSRSLARQFYQLQDSEPPTSQIKQPSPQKDNPITSQRPLQKQKQEQLNINNIKQQHSSHRNSESVMDVVEDEEIKLPPLTFINNSMNQSSNNNSDAIFFTSRFQDYLNNKQESTKKQNLPDIQEKSPKKQQYLPQVDTIGPWQLNTQQNGEYNDQNNVQNDRKEDYVRLQRHLKNNASGQSLAFSNDSSLKLSLNESAIHDVISNKLSHQLVLQSIGTNNPLKAFQQFCLKLQFKAHIHDFISFTKQVLLHNYISKTTKTTFIDNLMINKQVNFQTKKNEIKAGHHLQLTTQNLKRNIFYTWKAISENKIQSISSFIEKRQTQVKSKCFRTFKMVLFDRRINNQVDNYFLSKIFYGFKSVVEKERKKMNQKVFKCYSRNLKRSMFYSLVQGCNKSKRERQIAEMAENHYYFSLLSTVFSAWKETTPKQQKFIRLAMTTKNILKESKDNKLLQTKTFDFYQIK